MNFLNVLQFCTLYDTQLFAKIVKLFSTGRELCQSRSRTPKLHFSGWSDGKVERIYSGYLVE